MTREHFILEIGQAAQRQMKKHNILASLILAQACLESNFGQSELARSGKNLFGVKGKGIALHTKEFVNGQWITTVANFAKYSTWDESLEAHSQLFLNGVSWDPNKYRGIIGERDYKKACRTVQEAGYATDPKYADKLIKLIEDNKFFAWDKVKPKTPSIEGTCKVRCKGITIEGVIIGGISYAPVREVSELLGASVDWDEKDKIVDIQ